MCWFYRVSGLKDCVDWVDLKVTNYRLRLRIVPFSYKVLLVSLGLVIGTSYPFAFDEYQKLTQSEPTWTFEQPLKVDTVQAETKAPIEEKAWLKAWVTAYTASVDETDDSPLVMASQKMVYIGAIACPRDIPLGVQVEIKGHGVYTCEDRKAKKHDGEFDIFMLTKKEAFSFGRKFLEYRIIN